MDRNEEEGKRKQPRRKKKTFRETLRLLLECELTDEGQRRALEELGLAPTYMNQINLSGVKKAAAGDTAAARFIRDTVEDKTAGNEELRSGGKEAESLSRMTDEELRSIIAKAREKKQPKEE